MPASFSTENKICIRNNFNKIIIQYLKESCGCDIIYFGLPSPDAEDVEAWLEYISYVIAFQCRDYKQISSPDLPTDEVDKLIAKLNGWEAAGQIDGYTVYDGYMEEVIFNGYDNSASGSVEYNHDRCVTLFNLDFCNSITSPRKYRNISGDTVEKYKFEIIDKILEYQYSAAAPCDRFVVYLTLNSGYNDRELVDYCNANAEPLAKYSALKKAEKRQFILKHFVCETLYEKIKTKGFIPQFLPTIFYNGINQAKMMQFAVMCIKPDESHKRSGVFVYNQRVADVLAELPITPTPEDNSFVGYTIDIDGMNAASVNFMSDFCESQNFKKYWKRNDAE